MTVNDLKQMLDLHNVNYELIKQKKPIRSVQDAADYYPIDQAAPTFVLQTEREMIACIVSAQNGRLDFAKLKQQFGFAKLKMADAKKIQKQTGYEIGSIPLVGLNLRCIFDKKLLRHDYVYGGTGDMLTTLKISPGDLLRVNEVIEMFE